MVEQANLKTQTYGKQENMPGVQAFLRREFSMNRRAFAAGKRRRAPCIWGPPGIGKTDVVKAFVEEGYVIKHVPVAQFEEMGDINGIPKEELDKETGTWITKTCPPEWVPNLKRDGKKVILLLDDFNRADPRIVKGTMQLIQDYGMTAWSLNEEDYHIVCTANPEGGLNDVTPLDPAQISRFSHITLHVEGEDGARAWARWADTNGVDKRAISFILMHNAFLFTGKDRVNPRTWTQAFDILADIKDNGPGQPLTKDQAEILSCHVEACVDKDAADAFITFMVKGIMEMIEPEQLLDDLESVWPKLQALSGRGENKKVGRMDCMFAIYERLYLYLCSDHFAPKENDKASGKRCANFCKVISGELAGMDMRWGIARRLFWGSEKLRAKMRTVISYAKVVDKDAAATLTKMLVDAVEN